MRVVLMGFFLILMSLQASSETAIMRLVDSFGDYFLYDDVTIDINPKITTIAGIKAELKSTIGSSLRANLVLVGYGESGCVGDFFAASRNVDHNTPLAQVFPELIRAPGKNWYIYFIDRDISHIVTDHKRHHPDSPFSFLAEVGMKDLTWF